MDLTAEQHKLLADANHAKVILENPYFQELSHALQRQHFNDWDKSQSQEDREKLWQKHQALKNLVMEIRLTVQLATELEQKIQENP